MNELPESAPLSLIQAYVHNMEVERGFSDQSTRDKCLLLGEEVGELFKAIRNSEGIAIDPESDVGEIADELTDVLIYLCAIANRYEIDLERAFRAKEAKNQSRTWKT